MQTLSTFDSENDVTDFLIGKIESLVATQKNNKVPFSNLIMFNLKIFVHAIVIYSETLFAVIVIYPEIIFTGQNITVIGMKCNIATGYLKP